jgi:hypothetical protein
MKGFISMKAIFNKMIIIVVLFLSVMTFNSQSQTSFSWCRQFGTDKEDYVRNHVLDQNGNILISGYTYGNLDGENAGKKDGFITKFDSLGNIKWSRQFGSAEDEDIQWSAIDNKDCVYITGTTTGDLNGKSFGKEDIFVVKYNTEGLKLWTKQFGTDSIDLAYGIFADNKGFVYICGATLGTLGKSSSGMQDAFIMKLDSNGFLIYTNQFGTALHDGCGAITGDNLGNIYVTGPTFGNLGGTNKGLMDVFVGQFSDKGKLIKYTQFGSDGFDVPTTILLDNENNIYVGGTTSGNFGGVQMGEGDCFIMKISPKDELLWNNQFGTSKNDGVKAIAFNKKISDNILISGLTNLAPAHAYIRMYKKDGSLLWEKNIISDTGNDDASGKDISLDDEGNIVHLGLTLSKMFGNLAGESDIYLIKLRLD